MYLSSITKEQKELLKTQLSNFVGIHRNSNAAIIKREWLKLGAQFWQQDINIVDALVDFIKIMK